MNPFGHTSSQFRTISCLLATLIFTGSCAGPSADVLPGVSPGLAAAVSETYAEIAYHGYEAAHRAARELQQTIDRLLAEPTAPNLGAARRAWLEARESYGRTEVHRFYGGPIDGEDQRTGQEGPEGRLNAWPLNEAALDYVAGNPTAGIINDPSSSITRDSLIAANAARDEADVTTGFHAVEFLLWGQDHDTNGPGRRLATDFAKDSETCQRRSETLEIVTQLLVDDLRSLAGAWAPDSPNYRARFKELAPRKQQENVMTGIVTLAGFELAAERIGVPLESGDQEDEHSCFSDNTHRDFVANLKGISDVFYGRYDEFQGTGLHDIIAANDASAAAALVEQLQLLQALAEAIPPPIDRILATPRGSPERQVLENLAHGLEQFAEQMKLAAAPLGLEVAFAFH